jgi:HEPN domain-containing protein
MMRSDDPTDPNSWLQRAKSNLLLAEQGEHISGVFLEDLCFNAHQAAEKALKAICIYHGLEFPKTHSLVRLMDILEEGGITVPSQVKSTDVLTQYAVQTRYPGLAEEITQEEYLEARRLARLVVLWADALLSGRDA